MPRFSEDRVFLKRNRNEKRQAKSFFNCNFSGKTPVALKHPDDNMTEDESRFLFYFALPL